MSGFIFLGVVDCHDAAKTFSYIRLFFNSDFALKERAQIIKTPISKTSKMHIVSFIQIGMPKFFIWIY